MKSSASESVKNGYFNLELAHQGISPLNGFDSDTKLSCAELYT